MAHRLLSLACLVLAPIALAACGSSDAAPAGADGGASTALVDPETDGPFAWDELEEKPTLAGEAEVVHCVFPTSGPAAGPYPIVLLEHGFGGTNAMMAPYAERLASFGHVACEVDYPSGFAGVDNGKQAAILRAGLDWAIAQSGTAGSKLAGKVDAARVGVTGHSLGGKLSLLVALQDPRVKAALLLDPVDGGGPTGCAEPACFDVSAKMPSIAIPTGFLGETVDATTTGFQACAPAAENFTTFYANAKSPSFQLTVAGANHLSFVGQQAGAGVCNPATTPTDDVMALSVAYVVAFHERHLRGATGYDAYLTGDVAKERYVDTGRATLEVK